MTRAVPTLRCLACGYDIASLIETRGRDEPGVCPECGEGLRDVVRAPCGTPWQQRPGVRSFFATHWRTISASSQAYAHASPKPCLWLGVITLLIAAVVPALVAPPMVWWLFAQGTDGHVVYDTFLSAVEQYGLIAALQDPAVMAQTYIELVRVPIVVAVFLAPAPIVIFLLIANLSLFASIRDAGALITVVMPHASACLLFPAIVAIVSVPAAIIARQVWPSPRESAGAELLILVLLLSFLASNIGFAASCLTGALELRRRHKVSS